jgi:hypothetical protein
MPEENLEIVHRLYASWERGDLNTPEFFDAGMVLRYHSYWDRAEALEAAGLCG